jgi:PAS domain S-box-containing protein
MITISRQLSPAVRYGVGLSLTLVAVLLQWTLVQWVGARVPFLIFIPTLALSAALLGRGPACIVLVAGLLHGSIVLPPFGELAIAGFADRVSLFAYGAVGLLFIYFGGMVRSITQRAAEAEQDLFAERLRTQDTAREHDARFRIAVDTSAVPFTILTPVRDGSGRIADFRWTYMNAAAAAAFGLPADQLIGRAVGDVLPGTWNEPDLFARYVEVSEQHASQTFELHSQANGIEGWFHVVASSLQDSVVVWFADVTAQKQQENMLRAADRRKDEFLAMLAHELRNPLAPISAAAELMERAPLDDQRLKQTSRIITRQVRHMTDLVDDLIDVSRVTRGLVTLSRSPQDLKSIVANAVEQVRPIITARRHHLGIDLTAAPAMVLGDRNRLVQVVANLLNNAAKYTPDGGAIELRLTVGDGHAELAVSDNGIGIAPELQAQVFDLFSQAERTADRSQGGLGLGLALVKSLIGLHGGEVECSSAGPGAGSRFTVRLPSLPAESGMIERRRRPREPKASAASLRIMVVDDNADAATMLAMFLETLGHEVAVEHDPVRALERVRGIAPDACILDIGLPGMDGHELARRLRALPETADILLIAATGYGREHDHAAALAAGFDHHLVKPVDTKRLSELLADGAQRRQRVMPG